MNWYCDTPVSSPPGKATKGAFRAGGADRNRTSGGSQLLRAGVQRDAIPLCWVQGRSALLGQGVRVAGGDLCGKAAKAPTDAERRPKPIGGLRAASPIGSRVKRLAQGELMPCVNSYWVLPDAEIRRFGGFAAAPLREKSTENGGMKIETDTA